MLNWQVSGDEMQTIRKIAKRAVESMPSLSFPTVEMDVTACHCNGCPLDLAALLAANELDFIHDVCGINAHIDRETGKLQNEFDPRYSRSDATA